MATNPELHAARRALHAGGLGLVSTSASAEPTDPVATAALRSLIGYNSFGWTPSFAGRMRVVPVEVLADDLCNACIVRGEGDFRVFVGRGLLKAIVYFEAWIHLGAAAADHLEQRGLADPEVLQQWLYAAFTPLIDFVRYGEHLAKPVALTVPDRAIVFVNCAMAAQFMMMHELGHAACGHFDTAGGAPCAAPTTLSALEPPDAQAQELEADRHVLQALRPDFKPMAGAYCLNLMMLIGMLERHIGGAESHPLAVRRMEQLVQTLGEECEPSIVANVEAILAFHRGLWSELEDPVALRRDGFATQATATLGHAYRLRELQATAELPTPNQIEKAALWDQLIENLWDEAVVAEAGQGADAGHV